jgi:hypothetical protein
VELSPRKPTNNFIEKNIKYSIISKHNIFRLDAWRKYL